MFARAEIIDGINYEKHDERRNASLYWKKERLYEYLDKYE